MMSIRISSCIVFVFILFMELSVFAGSSRLAIVPGGDPKPIELLTLAEAKLFELNGIELVERTEIGKVLAEQKLSGLFNASNAVELGRILKVEIFAVLETTSIIVFDTKTGLRFVDETLPENLDEAVQMVSNAVKNALEKRRKLDEKNLVTYGVLEIRNADFPVERDAWCKAVAGMLERSLLHQGAAVLERSRLRHVNDERRLTGDGSNDLLASVKLIDLEFTRGTQPKSFKLTARIGGEIRRIEGMLDKPLDAVRKLAEQLFDDGDKKKIDSRRRP